MYSGIKMKHKNKLNNKPNKEQKKPEQPTTSPRTLNIASYAILLGIFLLSLYIRAIRPFKNAFINNIPAFAIDDAVMHMRLVENTIKFFPQRIFFDAYTRYPFGTHLHWGPLTDQLIAFFAIVAGLGTPSQDTINLVGMLFPAVFGALTVIPVFFIGKYLHSNKAGLIAAFLTAILPGQWLSRSFIGFTDNHILEVFFTTVFIALFIITLKKSINLKLSDIVTRNWSVLKTPLLWSVLTGIALGAYIQSWSNGMLFVGIMFLFVFFQSIIDHLHGRSTAYLGFTSIVVYLVTLLMVLPYFDPKNGLAPMWYSWFHVLILIFVIISSFLCVALSEYVKKKYTQKSTYPLTLFGVTFLVTMIMKFISPTLYGSSFGQLAMMIGGRSDAGLTIAEAMPTSYDTAMAYFGFNYLLAYIGMILLLAYVIKTRKPEYTLVFIWCGLMVTLALSQVRFTYYYAINVAVLVGLLSGWIMNMSGWKTFDIMKPKYYHSISLIFIIMISSFLPLASSPYKTTMDSSQYGQYMDGFFEWYESLNWMRNNTPDPGLPYNAIYEQPSTESILSKNVIKDNNLSYNSKNKNTTELYPYPDTAYGVMSWWDYGHIITYWAHRIPNANPFQEGIGGSESHRPGASTYFTASSEKEANDILDNLSVNGKPGAKYIISNAYMMYSIQPVFAQWNNENPSNYFTQIRTNTGNQVFPSMRSYTTMEARLHMFDGNGLEHYRLVHESTPNPNIRGGNEEMGYKEVWNKLYGGNVKVEPSGYVKIFEYVNGYTIKNKITPNTDVTISNTIKTNIGREFEYVQKTISDKDGNYEITVPYSTTDPVIGGTNFDTRPTGDYKLVISNKTEYIKVEESDT